MARAFKVPVPKSYHNVNEAKLIQKGSNVWVQLPTNLVTDKKMSRKSVYMDDFNFRPLNRYNSIRPKINTRRSSYPQFNRGYSYPQEDLVPGLGDTNRGALTRKGELNLKPSKKFGEPSSSFYEGMQKGKYYESVKYKTSEPIQAFLPVMMDDSPGLSMNHHYAEPLPFQTTQELSTVRSYNDLAREALPGLGAAATSRVNDTIERADFLENPIKKADLLDHDVNGSIQSPAIRSMSRLGLFDTTGTRPYSTSKNSARRHGLEVLAKVNASGVRQPSLDHLYQPSGSSGYRERAPTYENEKSTFFHTAGNITGSFTVAPDWVSERKRAVFARH